jgi:hypothetical protein
MAGTLLGCSFPCFFLGGLGGWLHKTTQFRLGIPTTRITGNDACGEGQDVLLLVAKFPVADVVDGCYSICPGDALLRGL